MPLRTLRRSRSGCQRQQSGLGKEGLTHEFEGVFIDVARDVCRSLADDLLDQGTDDWVHLRLKVLSNFFALLFFHQLI